MKKRGGVVGLSTLCAVVLFGLFPVQNAAAFKGTTAFTCSANKSESGSGFAKTHCRAADAVGSGAKFVHTAIAENTTTRLTVSNEKTGGETAGLTFSILKATVAGVPIELQASIVHGEGGLVNKKDAVLSGEHYIHGEAIGLEYVGVVERKLGCEVIGKPGGKGKVETKALTATTTGLGDAIKLMPEEGTVIAEFELKNCLVASTYKVVGSVTGKPDGATINFGHEEVTASKTLRLQSAVGPVAGLEGALTFSGSHLGEERIPYGVTTVETP